MPAVNFDVLLVVHDRAGAWLRRTPDGRLVGFRIVTPDDLEVYAEDGPVMALLDHAREELNIFSASMHAVATIAGDGRDDRPVHVFTVKIDASLHRPASLEDTRYVEPGEVIDLVSHGDVADAATVIGLQDLLLARDEEHRRPKLFPA